MSCLPCFTLFEMINLPHFVGAGTHENGSVTLKFELVRVHHLMFNRLAVIMLSNKLTSRQTK